MISNRLRHLFVCLPMAAALALPGCNADEQHPVEPASAALTAENNLKNISENLTASTGFLAESDAIAEVLAGLQDCEESPPACDPAADPLCGEDGGLTEDPASCGPEAVKADLREMNQEIDELLQKLLNRLRKDILIEANIESKTDTEIVYRVPQAVLCEMTDEPDCAEQATRAETRVKVTSPAEGDLDLAVLMTPKRLAPLLFKLYRGKVGVSFDLAAALETMKVVAPEEADEVEIMSGVFSLALAKNAPRDFSLLANVEKSIHLVSRSEDGKKTDMRVEASAKAYEIRLDGVKKSITAAMNLGAVSVKMPLENIAGTVDAQANMAVMSVTDIVEFVLGGINGSITFDGNSDNLALKGLGLGNRATAFVVNGEEIIGLDVNKDSGRRFDLTVTGAKASSPLLTFDPGLNIELRLKFKSIADKFTDLSPHVLDDTLRFALAGNKPSLRNADKGTEVVSGTLSLTSAAKPASNISVAAGMCLVSSDSATEDHLLSAWTAGTCE